MVQWLPPARSQNQESLNPRKRILQPSNSDLFFRGLMPPFRFLAQGSLFYSMVLSGCSNLPSTPSTATADGNHSA